MELQTMPLRFRVWDRKDNRFYRLDDLVPGIAEPAASDTKFSLSELFELQKQFKNLCLTNTRFIISQDTRFKDKNGESIYTGDVVPEKSPCATVVYKNGHVQYQAADGGWWMFDAQKVKVVGNIWQNPELLEEK